MRFTIKRRLLHSKRQKHCPFDRFPRRAVKIDDIDLELDGPTSWLGLVGTVLANNMLGTDPVILGGRAALLVKCGLVYYVDDTSVVVRDLHIHFLDPKIMQLGDQSRV